jgi:hypothetical protein
MLVMWRDKVKDKTLLAGAPGVGPRPRVTLNPGNYFVVERRNIVRIWKKNPPGKGLVEIGGGRLTVPLTARIISDCL